MYRHVKGNPYLRATKYTNKEYCISNKTFYECNTRMKI